MSSRVVPRLAALAEIARAVAAPVVVLAAMLASHQARALEVRLSSESTPELTMVELSGQIVRGDAQRVQRFIAEQPKGRPIAVSFNSGGGLIDEALAMGRHFHAHGVRTYVSGKGRQCLSACALAFLGGRDETGRAYRVKGSEARIGFHNFRRNQPTKEFTVADMHEAVAITQQVILTITDYMTDVEADIEFLSMMLEAPNASMTYLSNEKAPSIGVHVLQEATGRLIVPVEPANRAPGRLPR